MHILDTRAVWLKSVLVVILVASLPACTEAVTTGPASPKAVPSKPPTAVVSPSGSASVGCDESRPATAIAARDWILGPLSFPGYTDGRVPAPDARNAVDTDGVRFFKIGTHLLPDHSVTVTIGEAARSYAGIRTERGPDVGYSSVTYTSCGASSPSIGPGGVWWVGGFTLVGRSTACVPLDVQVKGEAAIRHVQLLIGESTCN